MLMPRPAGERASPPSAPVYLSAGHLCLSPAVAGPLFSHSPLAFGAYYPAGYLLLASGTDEVFRGLHKSRQFLLKHKDAAGTLALSLQELLLDFGLDASDRPLLFEEAGGILKITLA